MKKVYLIIILILSIILLERVFYKFILPFYNNLTGRTNRPYRCPFPAKEGVNICCVKDCKTAYDCTDKSVFKCGEKIDLTIRIENISTPSFVCWNMSYFNLSWSCTQKILRTPYFIVEPDMIVPKINGRIPFIQLYFFPLSNNASIDEMLAHPENFKEILSMYREVRC